MKKIKKEFSSLGSGNIKGVQAPTTHIVKRKMEAPDFEQDAISCELNDEEIDEWVRKRRK